MRTAPGHVGWIVDTGKTVKTSDGCVARILELRHTSDPEILSDWARHFRNQYCCDTQIDALRRGTKQSRADYLRDIKFPDAQNKPGPSIRSGDFGEVLVADYLEFALGYWLPRTRYRDKKIRNESTKGSDIIGFKVISPGKHNPRDSLAMFEAKAQFAGTKPTGRLQDAVDDSAKDELRRAESLNAIKQRFLDMGRQDEVATVERFQNIEDLPYVEEYGAVAIVSSSVFDRKDLRKTTTVRHPHANGLTLLVISGDDLMKLTHELYRRAADEA